MRAVEEAEEQSLWRLQLTVRGGVDAGKHCTVDRDVVTVGKRPDCDLVLTDASVSRQHLRISRMKDDRWSLCDLGSTNGTFVNGARIKEATIEAGAILKAAEVEIAFVPRRDSISVPVWEESSFGPLLGSGPSMRRLFGMIARIAQTDATVLIQGETGTGKGLVAKAIHQASLRAKRPYMVVDCGAVQRQLIESELFGHEKGAFSGAYSRRQGAFELASSGTIFIDELGELELDMQPKLLRVLDAREIRRVGASATVPVNIRVVAASRRDLGREVERGAFREDLYFRLSVVTLTIPPLRDRPEDIPGLAQHFLTEVAERRGVRVPRLSAETLDRLTSHDWPGNVRELKNAIERAALLAAVRPGAKLEIGALTPRERPTQGDEAFDPGSSFSQSKERWLAKRERAYLEWILGAHEGNVSAAARAARMDRKYLHKLIKKHEL